MEQNQPRGRLRHHPIETALNQGHRRTCAGLGGAAGEFGGEFAAFHPVKMPETGTFSKKTGRLLRENGQLP